MEAAKRISECEDFLNDEVVRALAEHDRADDLRDCVTVGEFLLRLAEMAGNHYDPDDEWSGRGPGFSCRRGLRRAWNEPATWQIERCSKRRAAP